ncbi:hypothetical protein P168DRAFT_32514 [Aspergillus campestris IBT 28561]|uniref:Uncharacterized protein n=1 Tax=Aspergillus campestris (strain IBT 28561) TaxID=1392248 RepID=A0A2I1DH28_ASPC2|nr:uncharacterized protein P168DRAFT_32514 [Aspergillus campestris IBT 28561]PKY09182.1 hypothetical protein P168DRAFT_32514 [Aspergillus campestris IBT 28561]
MGIILPRFPGSGQPHLVICYLPFILLCCYGVQLRASTSTSCQSSSNSTHSKVCSQRSIFIHFSFCYSIIIIVFIIIILSLDNMLCANTLQSGKY